MKSATGSFTSQMRALEIYIDGASKGNPGPSGIGVIICSNGHTLKNMSAYIGNTTNNVAEYTALIYALQEAIILKAETVKINTDSQLLHRQIKRLYKVKNPNIAELFIKAQRLLSAFKEVSINNILRKDNKDADKLATEAIKKELKKKSLIAGG